MADAIVKLIAVIVGFVLLVVVIGLLMSWPVMMLWNGCLVPAVAGLKEIGWLQAWGILVLFGILFRSSNNSTSTSN